MPRLGERHSKVAPPADATEIRADAGEFCRNDAVGVGGYSIARQWVWRCLQRRADSGSAVPDGQQQRVFAESVRPQQRQLDRVPYGVAAIQRLRDVAELAC